jgi:hypothetical protein
VRDDTPNRMDGQPRNVARLVAVWRPFERRRLTGEQEPLAAEVLT